MVRSHLGRLLSTQAWVDAKDLEWREALRRVSLIAELDLDDSEVERAENVLGLLLEKNAADRIGRRYPAFLAVSLATAGMRSWEEGTFYRKVADNLFVSKASVEAAARAFPGCLKRLDLPSFKDAGGMRWVTPILLHGAVPLDHLDELLDLLARRRQQDPSLTAESFVEWVRVSPAQVQAEPRAMIRFLEHGGDFASDYVARVMDFVDGRDVVLPRRVIERLRVLMEDVQASRYRSSGKREARPAVARTHDGSLVLRLPAVRPPEGRTITWRVTIGERIYTREAAVPWGSQRGLTEGLTLEVDQAVRAIHVERPSGETDIPFVRKEDPLLVFDANGDLVPPTQTVPQGTVVLMWPDVDGRTSAPVDQDGNEVGGVEEQAPYGWEKWTVRRVDLSGIRTLRLGRGPRRIVTGADRPRIITPSPVESVATTDGREVLGSLPVVELPATSDPGSWQIQLADNDGNVLESVRPTAHRVELLADRAAAASGELTLEVRGPLGRGSRRVFALVEGLTVDCSPPFRPLDPEGGLVPATITITARSAPVRTLHLARDQRSYVVEFPNLSVVIRPPHIAFRAMTAGVETPWAISPVVVSALEIKESILQLTGWSASTRPQLFLTAGTLTQSLPATEFRGRNATFNLAAFSGAIGTTGAGSLYLTVDPPVKVATIRPSALAHNVVRVGSRLLIDPAVSTPLEVVTHRAWAPWTTPTVLPVIDDAVNLPAELERAGALRVQVRELDEWGVAPLGPLPRSGVVDVFDVEGRWSPDVDDAETRALVRILSDSEPDFEDPITDVTAARIFELLRHTADGQLAPHRRRHLVSLLTAQPDHALHGVLVTNADAADITWGIVESGLLWEPVSEFARTPSVEALANRSPLAATLAASNRVRSGDSGVEASLAEIVGDGILTLAAGQHDQLSDGRFEPWYISRPDVVEHALKLVNPVPTLPIDPDSRIAASYEMWRARSRLSVASKYAMPAILAARKVLLAEQAERLWPLVEARLTQDGVIALPALSIALAITARLAAHGSEAAHKFIEYQQRYVYPPLARWAPRLVGIDAIRADAAVRSLFL